MPASQEAIRCTRDRWTLLNGDGAVAAMSFAVVAGNVYILGTTTAAYPEGKEYGWPYDEGEGELQRDMVDLFYTASTAHVWAKARGSSEAVVVVDYIET